MRKYRLLTANALVLIALLGSHWGRSIEAAVVSQPNLLAGLNVPFNGWLTTDIALSSVDLDLLQPDAALVRNYTSPDDDRQWAQLAVIAGHRKRSVHTPTFCLVGSGWELISQQALPLQIGGQVINSQEIELERPTQRGTVRELAVYFFTDGRHCTTSLVHFQLLQIWQRFQSEVPIGALIRVIVPEGRSRQAAEQLAVQFAAATVPEVMRRLRSVHVSAR